MTSEAHKRNPPGSERWGEINKARAVEPELHAQFGKLENERVEIDVPRVYGGVVDARDYDLWRAARSLHQALGAQ